MGRAFGLLGFMSSLGTSFGPLLGGVLFDVFGAQPRTLWSLIAAGMALTALMFAVFLTRVRIRL
jgi:MFS family permease